MEIPQVPTVLIIEETVNGIADSLTILKTRAPNCFLKKKKTCQEKYEKMSIFKNFQRFFF